MGLSETYSGAERVETWEVSSSFKTLKMEGCTKSFFNACFKYIIYRLAKSYISSSSINLSDRPLITDPAYPTVNF